MSILDRVAEIESLLHQHLPNYRISSHETADGVSFELWTISSSPVSADWQRMSTAEKFSYARNLSSEAILRDEPSNLALMIARSVEPNRFPEFDPEALLNNIRAQISSILTNIHKPAEIKMHSDTWAMLERSFQGIMIPVQKGDKYYGKLSLYGLRVTLDHAMKIGTARVYMEWDK